MKVTFNYWIGKVVEKNGLISSRVSRALYHIEFFRIYLVGVKIERIKNEEEKMGTKRVWLEVKRGEIIVGPTVFSLDLPKFNP